MQILNYIADCQRERGYPPSVREIGEAVGLDSAIINVVTRISELMKNCTAHASPR